MGIVDIHRIFNNRDAVIIKLAILLSTLTKYTSKIIFSAPISSAAVEVVQPGRQPTFKDEKEDVTGGHEKISIHQIPEKVYHNNQEAGNCNRA